MTARRYSESTNCVVADCDQMHEINVPLLRKVYEHILHNPEEWNQGTWGSKTFVDLIPQNVKEANEFPCKTAACFAGWTAQFAGHDFNEFYPAGSGSYSDGVPRLDMSLTTTKDAYGYKLSTEEAAAHDLGLTHREAALLFEATNTMDQIREHLTEFTGEQF